MKEKGYRVKSLNSQGFVTHEVKGTKRRSGSNKGVTHGERNFKGGLGERENSEAKRKGGATP